MRGGMLKVKTFSTPLSYFKTFPEIEPKFEKYFPENNWCKIAL